MKTIHSLRSLLVLSTPFLAMTLPLHNLSAADVPSKAEYHSPSPSVESTKLIEKAKQEIMAADSAFCALAKAKGTTAAFVAYADQQGILYRPRIGPVSGIEAIEKLLTEENDEGQLVWAPDHAFMAASCDLGYTLGHYSYTFKNEAGETLEATGNYCSIWKKQPDGSWKYVLDTGIPVTSPKVILPAPTTAPASAPVKTP